jgi:hypothetical protein
MGSQIEGEKAIEKKESRPPVKSRTRRNGLGRAIANLFDLIAARHNEAAS